MAKPAVMAVDDDPGVLAAVARDLRERYGADYRIFRSASGAEALAAVDELKLRGDTVAVMVVDQRMPGMSGTEFLIEAKARFPEARTVLLTAYADTDATITAINQVGLDHYLLKPWDPPEERLYPVIDELLDDWRASFPVPYEGIRVIDTRWSPAAHAVKDFLARNQIPYRFLDVERDSEGAELAASAGAGGLPLVMFPDGTRLVRPDHRALAVAAGLQTEAKRPFYDLVVVGAGPAGLGAGVYAASEGLRVAILENVATGGQAGTSSKIENYLGFPSGISGTDLARRAVAQARKFGAEILATAEAAGVKVEDPVKVVALAGGTEISCRALLVATGMTIRRIEVADAERLLGAGVYYGAAPGEAASYRGEHVLVIGGANSAGQAAMMLSRFAGRVTMVVRGSSLEAGMSQYLVDKIHSTPNIDVALQTQVSAVVGDTRLQAVTCGTGWTAPTTIPAEGMFIFIGAVPHSGFIRDLVACDPKGFILTGPDLRVEGRLPDSWTLARDPFPLETSVPGIFAAGDVRFGVVRRVASAVGQGAVAVSMIHQYLDTV